MSAEPGTSLAQYDLDTEPDGSHETGRNHRDYGLERVCLRLFHAPSPPSKVLKIGTQLFSVVVFDTERSQHRCHRFEYDGIDALLLDPVLLGQRLRDDRSNLVVLHIHRFMILATFS